MDSHAKFWAKTKYVVFNIYARVKDDAQSADAHAGKTGDGRADADRLSVKLEVVLQRADAEFAQWRLGGPDRAEPSWNGAKTRDGVYKENLGEALGGASVAVCRVGADAVQETGHLS